MSKSFSVNELSTPAVNVDAAVEMVDFVLTSAGTTVSAMVWKTGEPGSTTRNS